MTCFPAPRDANGKRETMGNGMTPSQLAAKLSLTFPAVDVTHMAGGAQVWCPNGYGVSLTDDGGDGLTARPARITVSGDGTVECWENVEGSTVAAGARMRAGVSLADVGVMLAHLVVMRPVAVAHVGN